MSIERRRNLFWLAILIVALVALAIVVTACNSQEIMEESKATIDKFTVAEKQLMESTTALFGRLVQTRESVTAFGATMAQYAHSHDDAEMAEWIEEAAQQISEDIAEAAREHLDFLKNARQEVVEEIVGNLNRIYKLALDDAALFSLLQAPAGIFGIKFPTRGGNPFTNPPIVSGGTNWGGIAALTGGSIITSLLLVEGGKKGAQALAKKVAERSARKAAQVASAVADTMGDGRPKV